MSLKIDVSRYGGRRTTIPYDTFTFAGGEEHFRLDLTDQPKTGVRMIMISARLVSSAAIMQLIMATDAIRQHFGEHTIIELNAPYFPYARQDRVCHPGEAIGVKAMADVINKLCFHQVYITDPHSEAVKKYLHRCIVMPQDALFILHGQPQLKRVTTVISPDAGATDKAKAVQEVLKIPYLIQASKVRDTDTGRITGITVHGDVDDQHVLITDDICDGGGTFIGLGQMLKKMGARYITLFVTHGIFSHGFRPFEGIIDSIITTNSFRTKDEQAQLNDMRIPLTVMELEDL